MTDLPLTREELARAAQQGRRFHYLCFWGHRARGDGRLTEACFSQWYPAPFELDGDQYPTAEHYMMAEKAKLFGDAATRERILRAPSPSAAKALGREVRGFSEEGWRARRFDVVVAGSLAKFGQSAALREFLLATGKKVLVEASPVDRIWGIGLSRDDPRSQKPQQWPGHNLLGFALMAAREKLSSAR